MESKGHLRKETLPCIGIDPEAVATQQAVHIFADSLFQFCETIGQVFVGGLQRVL